jgi:hypothetical protein
VKYTYSGNTLNIDLDINNKRQDYKIGSVVGEGTSGGGG